jgi:hypothetical protein
MLGGYVGGKGTGVEGNPKSKDPSSKEYSNPKPTNGSFVFWSLSRGISLVFGALDLVLYQDDWPSRKDRLP